MRNKAGVYYMEKIIASGKTIEEAIQSALSQLGATEDMVNVTVLEQPGKRLFGLIGRKDAVVEVELKNIPVSKEDVKIASVNPIDEAKVFLKNIFKTMDLDVEIEVVNKQDEVVLNLVGDDLGILIGRRGQTLDSLQYLVNLAANKNAFNQRIRMTLDAESYRSRRKSTLENLASRLAEKVIRTGKDVVLEPMSPHERKIIHTELQNHPRVKTFSRGEEPNRQIVITRK